ncbi:ORN-like protein [Mya arenaria]|uniref:ORN-like protein n=1 Tax=Mya arenaria TaxID=6604 RepID=A0ABY7DTD8_MYAAR|nr:ORN-like protein [Mya arenaria]
MAAPLVAVGDTEGFLLFSTKKLCVQKIENLDFNFLFNLWGQHEASGFAHRGDSATLICLLFYAGWRHSAGGSAGTRPLDTGRGRSDVLLSDVLGGFLSKMREKHSSSEMSGLDVNKEHILEMACLVTDQDLNIIAECEDLVIHQPPTVLDNMGEWCKEHHGKSGLTEAVRRSQISLMEAEDRMLRFVKEHTLPGSAPLAGNSVHADRTFLVKYMPRFTQHLHYRIVDVSTVKELSRRWYPSEFSRAPKKKLSHRQSAG